MRKNITIWFTGIPCSGKTTLALSFKRELETLGHKIVHLDGDKLREGLCKGLGFSNEGRKENLKRVAHVAELLNQENIIVLASYVSPTEEMRDVVREIVSDLNLIHVDCSPEECANRDVKGMWKKAKDGEIKGFTGYDAPFEQPVDAELTINTNDLTLTESIGILLNHFNS
jgi:adenylylsulfate kinase